MNNLCTIKNVCRFIEDYELKFQKKFKISLNEGLLLCSLSKGKISSGEIAQELELSCSNTSKVLRSLEEKGLLMRMLGEKDKRQMYFALSEEGLKLLNDMEADEIEVPESFKLFEY